MKVCYNNLHYKNVYNVLHVESEVTPHVIANQALPLNKDIYQKAQTRSVVNCHV